MSLQESYGFSKKSKILDALTPKQHHKQDFLDAHSDTASLRDYISSAAPNTFHSAFSAL